MSRTSMSALALVLIGMAVAVGMRHAGPAGVQVHFSAAAAAESSLPCPAADVRLAAPIRIDPPAAGWDGRPVAVVATGALRAARFGHGARSVCSDYRNAQSVDTRFRAGAGTVFVPRAGNQDPITVELALLRTLLWPSTVHAGEPAVVQRLDGRRAAIRMGALPLLLIGMLICIQGFLATRNRGFVYNAVFLLALLANLDLTHGLGWRLLAGLFEPQVQTWAIWASGAVLWLAALRTVANYTGMGGMRWLDIGCTAASLALFAGMVPGSGVLPPGTAPGLAFAVLAAMLAAAAVGALRGQRGGSWALVAWGPLLLVLMVEIATGVISGWRVEAMLAGASVQVFVLGAALFAPVGQLRTHRDSLAASLTEDPLTGVSNRRALARALPRLVGNARDAGQPLSAVFVDVDHFKRINDLDGHDAGDVTLKAVARVLAHGVRSGDLVARLGGEEFLLLLPGIGMEDAVHTAERLRRQVETLATSESRSGSLTASFGVAELRAGESGENLVKRADAAMYRAKSAGRNRVEGARDAAERVGDAVA